MPRRKQEDFTFEQVVTQLVSRAQASGKKKLVVPTKGYPRQQVLVVRSTFMLEPGWNVQFQNEGGRNEALVITWP